MNASDAYEKIQNQWDQKLPFVVYNAPDSDRLAMFFQNNDIMYSVEEYSDSGFIFAPFDTAQKTILFPYSKSKFYSTSIPNHEDIGQRQIETTPQTTEDLTVKTEHIRLVEKGIRAIQSGVIKKVVLSRKEKIKKEESINPLLLFQRLIDKYAKAFVYLWFHPKVGMWIGATPEILLHSSNQTFFTMALAGTQPYQGSKTPVWEDKEVEEQGIVTDFIVNELSLISSTIHTSATYTHRAGTLLHLRTDIKGELKSQQSGLEDIIKILHPTPAVGGVPKQKAKSFILKNEGYDRKFYTGFLGELNINVEEKVVSNLYVNLRCMELKEKEATLYIGGGITKDSDPGKEWEETVKKTATMKSVLF